VDQGDRVGRTSNYQDWHGRYDDPASGLGWRLRRVRRRIGAALDRHQGSVRDAYLVASAQL
jgi:hypothetical protein